VKSPLGTAFAVLVGLTSLSCADEEANFAVRYAPGFASNGNAISVFGVFRDGRMSPEAWDEVGPRFSAALHEHLCEVAIDAALRSSNAALYTAVDDAARDEGITDPLLDKFAPGAMGDSILVIIVAGHVRQAKDGGGGGSGAATAAPAMRGGGGGRGRRSGSGSPRPSNGGVGHHGSENDVLQISASLFSRLKHESVALVSMSYKGASEAEALAKFSEKLAAAFPGATCRGWKPDMRPNQDDLRHLPER
jgi:hypothetical protein